MKKLVVYFSVEYKNTEKIAKAVAKELNADIFEIIPEVPYTKDDINYMKLTSRCNKEWVKKADIPIKETVSNIQDYDEIYVGFPIWYGCAPLVVSSFLKAHDLKGKKLYVFATSGGSKIGKTAQKLAPFIEGAELVEARLTQTEEEAIAFVKQ